MPLNPALHRFPVEASIIGRLVLSYGELELMVALILGNVIKNRDAALRMMFRVVGESARIGAADAMMRDAFADVGLTEDYAEGMGAVRFCIKIRNQFAHCHWADYETAGLFFTDLQDPARTPADFQHYWDHIDEPLAISMENYFEYAQQCLRYLEYECTKRTMKIDPTRPSARYRHPYSMPPKLEQPPLRNPPELHIPPWLSEDEKRLHVGHARAAQGGPPTPTRGQKALDEARDRKRARGRPARTRHVVKREADAASEE